jgi:hypothetical protein
MLLPDDPPAQPPPVRREAHTKTAFQAGKNAAINAKHESLANSKPLPNRQPPPPPKKK